MWLVVRRSILTKGNLLKGDWFGSDRCVSCGNKEGNDHLIFQCPPTKLIWCVLKCAFNLHSIPNDLTSCFDSCLTIFPAHTHTDPTKKAITFGRGMRDEG